MTINVHAPERQPGETFDAYRERREQSRRIVRPDWFIAWSERQARATKDGDDAALACICGLAVFFGVPLLVHLLARWL